MGAACHMVAGSAATGTTAQTVAFTPVTGDTFAIRNFALTDTAWLEQLIGHYPDADDVLRVRSPMLHDDVQGIRVRPSTTGPEQLLPLKMSQVILPQDTLTVELIVPTAHGASVTDVAVLGFYYSNLPEVNSRLMNPGDIAGRVKTVHTLEVPVTVSGTAGVWASASLSTAVGILHANTDYALIGYLIDSACAAVALRGPDTNNLRVGSAGNTNPWETKDWFAAQSLNTGRPHIPVFNSANQAATFVDVSSSAITGTVNVTLTIAELATS